ncbi:hypothetical protein E4U19_005723 [Claviceps sp. Clav32 group G5]|nr:hypothetical protein E4U19_005723 [Claviceps sp. Clav32 group G5]
MDHDSRIPLSHGLSLAVFSQVDSIWSVHSFRFAKSGLKTCRGYNLSSEAGRRFHEDNPQLPSGPASVLPARTRLWDPTLRLPEPSSSAIRGAALHTAYRPSNKNPPTSPFLRIRTNIQPLRSASDYLHLTLSPSTVLDPAQLRILTD